MHLVLNSFGTSLGVDEGVFVIKHPDGIQRIAPAKVSSITLRKGIRLTSNALYLAIEHQIEVLLVDRTGKPYGRLWSSRFGSISTIRRKQVDWARQTAGANWVRQLISQKIQNQMALLAGISPDHTIQKLMQKTVLKLDGLVQRIQSLAPAPIQDMAGTLRGMEGTASRLYWAQVSSILPPAYQFQQRSQHPAEDMFNCLLNYAYGILYGLVEGALIKAGVDPYIGVLHRDEYNRPSMVYDCMEPYRVWADFVVTDLCLQQAIAQDSFLVQNGAYWLEAYGKRILVQCMNDYLDDVVPMNKLSRSRRTHLELDAQRLATQLLQYKEETPAATESNSEQAMARDTNRQSAHHADDTPY